MKRILLFANTDWYFYNFRLTLANALKEKGFQVILVAPHGEYTSSLQSRGFACLDFPLRRRGLNPLHEASTLLRLTRLYRSVRPDLVHHFTIKCILYGSIAAQLSRVPAIVNSVEGLGYVFMHQGWRAEALRSVVAGLYRHVLHLEQNRVIFLNPDDRDEFLRSGLAPEHHVVLIRSCGIDTSTFRPRASPSTAGPAKILLATRLLWDKGVDEFVQAARTLLKEGCDTRFMIAGAPDEGNPQSIPEAVVRQWQEEGVVEVLGHRNDMPQLLSEIDIVVLPSYREGIPRILLEAAACALPIVTTDVPGCREVIEHGQQGFLVPPKDPRALTDAIRRLVNEPALRQSMGEAGRRKVMQEFDDKQIIRATLEVYQSLGLEVPSGDAPEGPRNAG